jgi:hypothetical protein
MRNECVLSRAIQYKLIEISLYGFHQPWRGIVPAKPAQLAAPLIRGASPAERLAKYALVLHSDTGDAMKRRPCWAHRKLLGIGTV